MGRCRITGKVPIVRAVQLRPQLQQQRRKEEDAVLEIPPWGVCCICLKRITAEKEGAAIHAGLDYEHLHSKLIRHKTKECAPNSERYKVALPRLRAWERTLRAEDQQAIAEMEATYASLRAETEKKTINGKQEVKH